MKKSVDVYRDWLGITEPTHPLNHYALLRLKQFEDDASKIRQHYRKMNAHVRKFAVGDFSTESQDLLNELARAMLCLTDVKRKTEYDATLGRRDENVDRCRSLEQVLILRQVVDLAQLDKARSYADAVGVEIRDALVQCKLAPADVVAQAFAESVGLPYLELSDVGVDATLLGHVPIQLARSHSCVPVIIDEGQLLVASPSPLQPQVEEELRLRSGMSVRSVLCTPAGIHEVIAKHYPKGSVSAKTHRSKGESRGFFGGLFSKMK